MSSISSNQFDYQNLKSWLELDKDNKPTDEVKFSQALDILLAPLQDSADFPDFSRKLFTVAVLPSILSADVTYQTGKKCRQIFKKIFPNDQDCYIKIEEEMPGLICCRENLIKGSVFFEKHIQHYMSGIQHINESCYLLDLTELDEWVKDNLQFIIPYLNEGTPFINEGNFSTVVKLADFFFYRFS